MRQRYRNVWRASWLLLLAFLLLVAGCGTIRVSGALNESNTSVSTGTVSSVHFTAIFGSNGTLINVTVVTLVAPFLAAIIAWITKLFGPTPKGRRGRMSTTEVAAKSMARSVATKVGNEVGRAIVRGVLGSLGGGKGR